MIRVSSYAISLDALKKTIGSKDEATLNKVLALDDGPVNEMKRVIYDGKVEGGWEINTLVMALGKAVGSGDWNFEAYEALEKALNEDREETRLLKHFYSGRDLFTNEPGDDLPEYGYLTNKECMKLLSYLKELPAEKKEALDLGAQELIDLELIPVLQETIDSDKDLYFVIG